MWHEILASVYSHLNPIQRSFVEQQDIYLFDSVFNNVKKHYENIPIAQVEFMELWRSRMVVDLYTQGEIDIFQFPYPYFLSHFISQFYERLPDQFVTYDKFIYLMLKAYSAEKRPYFESLKQKSSSHRP